MYIFSMRRWWGGRDFVACQNEIRRDDPCKATERNLVGFPTSLKKRQVSEIEQPVRPVSTQACQKICDQISGRRVFMIARVM
jgi:hypothetical protein